MGERLRCWCCRQVFNARDENDPWDGRLDGYCDDCALTRCDADPGQAHAASQERGS